MREVNLRAVDLNLLVLFHALVEARGVGLAAKRVHLSQPAMSRALARLRALFDDPLLVRGPAGLQPTPRAVSLQSRVAPVLAELRAVLGRASFDPATLSGGVTLAATDHQTILMLPRLMARLSTAAPGLDVTVVPFVAGTLEAIRTGAVDLGFGIAEQDLSAPFHSESLYDDHFVTVLRENHPAARNWSFERFLALDHVLVTILADGRGAIDTVLDALGRRRRIALRLPHFYAALSVVAQTDLVVTLPATIARRYAAGFGLLVLAPPVERPDFTIVSIWSDVTDADPANAWLRGLVRDIAVELPGT